jgi:hypothetical protein
MYDVVIPEEEGTKALQPSVTVCHSLQENTPKNLNLHQHCCEKLKFKI